MDAAQRESVRSKLAQLLAANATLACGAGGAAAAAAAAAAALEAAVYRPGIQKQPYTSAATALAAAARRAGGWWEFGKWAAALEGRGREAFVNAAVAAAEAAAAAAAAAPASAGKGQQGPAAAQGGGSEARALRELGFLETFEVSAGLLAATGAGKRVRALQKRGGPVGDAAARVVAAWRARVAGAGAK